MYLYKKTGYKSYLHPPYGIGSGSDSTFHPQTQRMNCTKMWFFVNISPTSQLIHLFLQQYSRALTMLQTSCQLASFCSLHSGTRKLSFSFAEEKKYFQLVSASQIASLSPLVQQTVIFHMTQQCVLTAKKANCTFHASKEM